MEVRLPNKNKKNVIILSVLTFVFLASGSFLLWRVNQEKTVAPEEGEATCVCPDGYTYFAMDKDEGGRLYCVNNSWKETMPAACYKSVTNCTPPGSSGGRGWVSTDCVSSTSPSQPSIPDYCVAEYPPYNALPYTTPVASQKSELIIYYRAIPSYTALAQFVITDPDGHDHSITASSAQERIPTGIILEAGEKVVVKAVYETAGGKAATGWQAVNSGNTCGSGAMGPPQGGTCERYPKVDVSSYISWAEGFNNNQSLISRQCWADAKEWEGDYDFNDFFIQFYYLPINTCDAKDAKWVTKPASSILYGRSIPFEYVTGDTDGVESSDITVKLDGTSVPVTKVPATGNAVNITVKGTLNTNGSLAPGSHKLEISWEDVKGAGGAPCYASTTFTVGSAPINTCDAKDAEWIIKPVSRIEFGKPLSFEYMTGDTDGVESSDITVKLDGTSVPVTKVPATDNAVNITVKGTLNTNGSLAPGSHKLEISWEDVKGAGGAPCYVYSMITILPENPEWDIEKQVIARCTNDWTANPLSNLLYTITITNTNTGSGFGKIDVIEDTLDPKVDLTKVTDISNGGVVENGKITWNLTSPLSDFDPGESKSFTYSISVGKEFFGMYENTVIATPGVAEGYSPTDLEVSVSIEAKCNIAEEPEIPAEEYVTPPQEPLPGTGIFDNSQNSLLVGLGLLILGFTWRILGRGIYISVELLGKVPKKISVQMKDIKEDVRAKKRIKEMKIADKRKKNFERKVVKD